MNQIAADSGTPPDSTKIGKTLTTGAAQAGWADHFATLDADKDGDISQVEWEQNWPKLKMDPTPTFRAMDKNVNNRVEKDEWTSFEKEHAAYGTPPKF